MGIQYLLRAITTHDDNELFAVLDEYDQILESIHTLPEVAKPEVLVSTI